MALGQYLLGLAVVLAGLSGSATAAEDWDTEVSARGVHGQEATAHSIALRSIQDKARSHQAYCSTEGGQASLELVYDNCWRLLPAPGFPRDYVCDLTGKVSCSFVELGDVVEVTKDSDLYEQSEVVGHVAAHEIYQLVKAEGDWGLLKHLDGREVKGWINIKNLKTRVVVEVTADADLYRGRNVVGHVEAGEQFLRSQVKDRWTQLQNLDGSLVDGWISSQYLKKILF